MISINEKIRMEGFYSFKVSNSKGESRDLSGIIAEDHKNLILDVGLNALGTTSVVSACKVGTGVTPVAVSQTDLATPLAITSTLQSSSTGRNSTAPYYTWGRRTFRFGQGTAAGNLTEVGVTYGDGSNLFSRALIVDSEGNPTTLTILSDEWLDVTYELRIYQDLVDKTFNITLLGVDHVVTVRPANVTSNPSGSSYFFDHFISWYYYYSQCSHYNGTIGTITGSPSGVGSSAGGTSYGAYSQNSLQRSIIYGVGLNDANLAGGIQSTIINTDKCSWQVGYSPAIAKDSFKTLTMNYTLSWGRYDPE